MIINTRLFGTVDVVEDKIITFKEGLPGFEDLKKYILVEDIGADSSFKHLQSIEDGDICFVIADPYQFCKDYAPIISEDYFEKLGGGADEDFVLYVTVCLKNPIEETTLNLAGPFVIHTDNRLGIQVITEEKMYTTKHKLVDLVQERS